MISRSPARDRLVVALALAAVVAVTAACQEQRDEFNPVRIFCPGVFDPVSHRCIIQTRFGSDEQRAPPPATMNEPQSQGR